MSIVKILPNLFKVEIPLPGNPLKTVNSYIIKAEKPLIIDTGFNMDICYAKLVEALNEIGVDFKHADYFVTHVHADHLGLAGRLTNRVYMSIIDVEIFEKFRSLEYWFKYLEYFKMNGFPKEDTEKILNVHPGIRYSSNISFNPVGDGEILNYGEYSLRTVLTPGHTPGHMCLYDEEKKILFSGDHILFDITPNISYWEGHESLGEYLKSLDKIYELEVNLVLPGHRSFQVDVKRRILEIKKHHERRLREIVDALRSGMKNAWQIAPYITWDIKYDSWEEIPTTQRWFIISETIAHLHHLEKNGVVTREIKNETIRWGLK
ncbi:MAG: MBL fold metallo-hydrolase [Thermoprotei archaeon]|jgi:glyoxylase-like metal-dependent hydrolase (beta-lactamase superfamily II)